MHPSSLPKCNMFYIYLSVLSWHTYTRAHSTFTPFLLFLLLRRLFNISPSFVFFGIIIRKGALITLRPIESKCVRIKVALRVTCGTLAPASAAHIGHRKKKKKKPTKTRQRGEFHFSTFNSYVRGSAFEVFLLASESQLAQMRNKTP